VSESILITGAAGFAGSHLLDLLEGEGRSIAAWRRPGEPLPAPPTGTRARWFELDILDRAAVRDAVAEVNPDVIYHLAGIAHVGASWDRTHLTFEVNVLGTEHLLDAAAALPRKPRVMVAGSALVYREQTRAITEQDEVLPASPYGLSKLAQEMCGAHAFAERGLPVLLTRPFNHIGPRQDPSFFASSVARQIALAERGVAPAVIAVGNVDSERDLSDVRDTVRAYRAIAERGTPGTVYNVCAGRAYRIAGLLDSLVSHAKIPVEIRRDPARFRPHDAPLVLGDHTRLRTELGWEPTVPMTTTLADLLEFWRHQVQRS
jgi:GDP-4-dehydro-6-deoxy-D-mannose reductase